MKQTLVAAIGGVFLVVGVAIAQHLFSAGWSWGLGILAVFLIVEGLDCLYAGITGRDGGTPMLFLWPWP